MKHNSRFTCALIAIVGLIGPTQNSFAALPVFADDQAVPSLAPMIKLTSPAVVNIAVRGSVEIAGNSPFAEDPFFRHFFGEPQNQDRREFQSAGSGVIVDADNGYILTNHHVIQDADSITITLLDERTVDAEVIGSDADTDVAVLKVNADNLTAIPLGDSDALEVGDFVVAIGNPFGFSHTVTSGIVSALSRSGLNRDSYEDFIQTDASINPGNSGGALIDLRGRLIGVNSAIISRSGGNLGIGFAIPINMAESIMQQLIEFGEVKRGLLGVHILSVSPEIIEAYGLKSEKGALIAEVTADSAAQMAGLEVGDVVVAIDDKAIESAQELRNLIGLKRGGAKIKISYVRDGKKRTATATLSSKQATLAKVTETKNPRLQGAEFADLNQNDDRFRDIEGVLVARVAPESPAAQRGLRSGDIIIKVNRERVRNLRQFRQAIENKSSLGLTILRGQQQMLLPIL